MNVTETILISGLVAMASVVWAQDKPMPVVLPSVVAGKQTYLEHCTACHGEDGRGTGPAATVLKTPPPDLRRLAIRHGGKFPEDYVSSVVRFGVPISAHGSSDMPVWGPVFGVLENGNELGVRRRIKELCDYLASIQDKES